MELSKVSEEIINRIKLLEKGRQIFKQRAEEKSRTVAEYYHKRAQVLMGLKNGKSYELNGETIINPPATTSLDIARGICWKEKMARDLAEGLFDVAKEGIRALQTEINAYQSIYRHQEEIENT